MPKYYFHIRHCGELISDEDGIFLPTLDAARAEARHSANDLVAADMASGRCIDANVIEVTTVAGRVLETLPVRAVLN
jgi:hypothetical protein